jgi:energy-coupling factor transporter ATP-binding protein EcfA2
VEQTLTQPSLKVTALHIERHHTLKITNWPADGLGWEEQLPGLVTIGGSHGSGKTLLLELIANAVRALTGLFPPFSTSVTNAWVDLGIDSVETGEITFRVVMGEEAFVETHKTTSSLCLFHRERAYEAKPNGIVWHKIHRIASSEEAFTASSLPGAVYLPSDRRFEIPPEPFKSSGKLNELGQFFFRLAPAKGRRDSVEAFLYSARWRDLAAKEDGRPEDARHFDTCVQAFQTFAGSGKRFVWRGGDLLVEIGATGDQHTLVELSGGEKHALLLVVELLRRWRKGSLILIDEPEKHLHPTWQTALWTMLEVWQKERGGQVIVATQSDHLLNLAGPSAFRL